MRAPQRASYVVDASVVVKWYVPEALSDRADALLDRLVRALVGTEFQGVAESLRNLES